MSLPQKPLTRWLLIGIVILLGVAVIVVLRHKTRQQEALAGAANGSANQSSAGPDRVPGKHPRPGDSAPAAGGSEAVAALVSDSSLSDAEVLAGLQRIVEDAGRKLDERLEALNHVLNLVPDDNPAILREIAARRVMPAEMRMRLLADTLNRPRRLQGELLVLLLENAAGDERKEVLHELEGLCGEDHGEDPAAWRKAVEALPGDP